MASIITVSIDLNKIDESRATPHKNGARYYNMTVVVNDEPDKYGNHASVTEGQTKEERDAKKDRKFLGNGKVIWSKPPEQKKPDNTGHTPPANDSDLPF